MNHPPTLVLALLAPFVVAWSTLAYAGNCQNGKTLYTKSTPATSGLSCSSATCHGLGVNLHNIQLAAGNPGAIEFALDGTGANAEMVALDLRNNLPLTSSDIDDLATYIFYAVIPQACPAAAANVTASPNSAAFGNINVGATSATQVIVVSNTGSGSANGLSYTPSNAAEFPVVKTCGASLAAGASCTITLSYKPAAAGADSDTYTITGTGGINVSIALSGTGVAVGPNVSAAPASASFGSVTVGSTSAGQTITISNSGNAAATSMTYPAAPTHFGRTTTCTATLNAGANCTITFTFSPTATGTFSPAYTITGSGISVSIALSGTGAGAPAANLQASPPLLAFGNITVGQTSAAAPVTITNVGGAVASGIVLSNSNASEFVVSSNNCGTTLNAGASCALHVAYVPGTAGTDSATLTFTYGGGAALSLSLSGTGVTGSPASGQLSLPATVPMASQNVGTASAPRAVTVTNVGAAPVTLSSITSSNAAEFPVSGSTCTIVSAGASCTFNVTFQPSATGGRNATITVASNGTGTPQTIAVTGTGTSVAGPPTATAVEYYNAALDHYFLTHIANEIAILDAGVQIQGWKRTGQSFLVWSAAGTGTSPVCRYYIPPGLGNSHFYGRGTVECNNTGQKNPSFINEDPQFFHVIVPVAGLCPAGTQVVYRVFSNRLDANHRYMIVRTLRDQMVVLGWLAEGDGPDLVVMCVPP